MKNKITLYKNLIKIKTIENNENFIKLDNKDIMFQYQKEGKDTKKLLNGNMVVRETVLDMLSKADLLLKEVSGNKNLSICVVYSYRSLSIQKKWFYKLIDVELKKGAYKKDSIELFEKIHTMIAVPEVAGHPTGGAIDVSIYDKSKKGFIDFGSKLYDFSNKNSFTFNRKVVGEFKKNRELLRTIMMKIGFAPYDGEWWHFSYGDKEWAYFYKKDNAIYKQKSLDEIIS